MDELYTDIVQPEDDPETGPEQLKALHIRTGEVKHRILKVMNEHPSLVMSEIYRLSQAKSSEVTMATFENNQLIVMRIAGLLERVPNRRWRITLFGKKALAQLDLQAKPKGEIVRNHLHRPSGTYSGSDLRNNSHRAGAYDAYKLPSVINGKVQDRV